MFDNTPIYKFLEQVRSQIRYRPAADKVCRELTEHMEDRMDGLAARGVPGREAAEQAVAAMGDPYEIGREIDRLYSPFRYQFSGYVLAIALGLLLGALTNNFLNTFSYHRLTGLLPIAPAEDLRYPMRPAPEDAPASQLRLATVYGSGTLGPYTVRPARDNGTAGVYPSPSGSGQVLRFSLNLTHAAPWIEDCPPYPSEPAFSITDDLGNDYGQDIWAAGRGTDTSINMVFVIPDPDPAARVFTAAYTAPNGDSVTFHVHCGEEVAP